MKLSRSFVGSLATVALAGAGLALARALDRGVSLRDRTVVITGGSRGLGLALAYQYAAEGARLVLVARDADELERARAALERRGAYVQVIACDVREALSAQRIVDTAVEHFGGIDVLVNNAGRIDVGPAQTMDPDDYAQALATHFWAPLQLIRAALPSLRARGNGRIVNIASIGGLVAVPHLLPYSVSKFALTGFSEGLCAELAGEGIRVTTVCPGLMRTGSARNARFKSRHEQEYAWFAVSDALPGLSISAQSAARRIVLASRRGEAHVVLSWSAQLLALVHGVAPGFVANVLGLANRLLPGPGGLGHGSATGSESETSITRSWLLALSRRAEVRYNQLPGPQGT